MISDYDGYRLEQQVEKALGRMRLVLDNERLPVYPSERPHAYVDKYHLAEAIGNATRTALNIAFDSLNINLSSLTKKNRLRFKVTEQCSFKKKATREVENPVQHVVDGPMGRWSSKSVTKVTEWLWDFSVDYEILIVSGNDENIICSRHAVGELVTSSEHPPRPDRVIHDPLDVSLNWLAEEKEFVIDRQHAYTPRRNKEVDQAVHFLSELSLWSNRVESYFTTIFYLQSHNLDSAAFDDQSLFVPVFPLFEHNLDEACSLQRQSILEKREQLKKIVAEGVGLISLQEAFLVVCLQHIQTISQSFVDGVGYIEDLLRRQLVAAIGKELQGSDLDSYFVFHNRKLCKEEFQPIAFCYAVRRPEHCPEGVLSLETANSPVFTQVCRTTASRPMQFQLNAATKISFFGERFVHGWVFHRFAGQSLPEITLNASARQFSGFVLLLGNIASSELFLPKFGIIIQNKDDLKLPLLLETIPTPKEFQDAVESLSPEQQRFAKSYRAMQLESTLFGICIIQIKPQMERLLNLPYDSLTKEIRLTQDLMELFIKYQIPSDLLSYSGPSEVADYVKVDFVKAQVKAMLDMIGESKTRELEEKKQERAYQRDEKENEIFVVQKSDAPLKKSRARKSRSTVSNAEVRQRDEKLEQLESKEVSSQKPQKGEVKESERKENIVVDKSNIETDYTAIPRMLDDRMSILDSSNAVRAAIITVGPEWTRRAQKALLAPPIEETLSASQQDQEKDKAFDLLDALTKSGALPFDEASFHVVIGMTHCFDMTLMDTLIKKNENPIESLERTTLIVGSTIQDKDAIELVKDEHIERIQHQYPKAILYK